MKFRYFLTAVFAGIALLGAAQTESDPMYMVLTMRNGDLKAIDIAEVNRLTFPEGNMIVEKKDATQEQIVLTEISTMEFSNDETWSMNDFVLLNSTFTFNSEASLLVLEGIEGKELCVYNVNGALMLRHIMRKGNITLDLSALSNGVYIANYNGQTLKFVKR